MPVYECDCEPCGVKGEYLRDHKNCYDTPPCPECGDKMRKVIRTPPKGYIAGNFDAFKSHVDGSVITNSRELAAHNERNGVVSMSEGYTTEQLLSDDFGKKREESHVEDVKSDMIEAYKMTRDGYKPKMEIYDE